MYIFSSIERLYEHIEQYDLVFCHREILWSFPINKRLKSRKYETISQVILRKGVDEYF